MSSSSGKVFLRGREHQLNPIQLVHLGCPWVVINCHNVRQGVAVADFLDDPFPYDMVRQAAKGLGADNVVCPGMDEFQH